MLIDFLLRQRCVIYPWKGVENGEDQYAPGEERPCRVQEGRYLEQEKKADTVTARAMMYCGGAMVPERSRVECEGRAYTVLACREVHGWGQAHLEVTLA